MNEKILFRERLLEMERPSLFHAWCGFGPGIFCAQFWHMKKAILAILISTLLFACEEERSAGNQNAATDQSSEGEAWEMPTERFSGMVKGTEVIFEHLNYSTYRLTVAQDVTEGEMNTERGFEADENATLYILNPGRPTVEQAYFVRYSNGELWMLDEQRRPMKKARFTRD